MSNFNFLASQDSVAFYIDDVLFGYGGFLDLSLIDLERVEVLRGPRRPSMVEPVRVDGLVDNVFFDRTVGERSQLTGRAQILWAPTHYGV